MPYSKIIFFFIGTTSCSICFAECFLFCQPQYQSQRDDIQQRFLNTQLVTNAPPYLVQTTQNLWLEQIKKCKTPTCIENELDIRQDELTAYSTLNQTLTQHFFKYKAGKFSKPFTFLQIHQLDQNRIKIEGTRYTASKRQFFNAYTDKSLRFDITNIEDQCQYQVNIQKAILTLDTTMPQCTGFSGIYRLYD